MDDKLTIFIAVTAAAVVLQMLILAGMFIALRKLSSRLQAVTEDVQTRLIPLLDNAKTLTAETHKFLETTRPKLDLILDNASMVSTTARNQAQRLDGVLTEVVDRGRLQAIRADELLTRTFDRVEDTSSKVQHAVTAPVKHVNGLLQAISVGIGTWFEKQKRPRNGSQNDEMFI